MNLLSLRRIFIIIVVISFGGFCLVNTSPLEATDSQKGIDSGISTENKELHQKLKEGCYIDAYIKQGENACEIKIRIKDDFKDSRRDDYYTPTPHDSLEIERAIYVHMPRDCTSNDGEECSSKNSRLRDNTLCGNDRLNYITYKNESKTSDVLQYYYLFRRLRRKDLDAEIINLGITYAELFRAAEELVVREKTKLGKGYIYRTKIVFKEIMPDSILFRPLKKLPY